MRKCESKRRELEIEIDSLNSSINSFNNRSTSLTIKTRNSMTTTPKTISVYRHSLQ